ncbi:MAG: RNA-binding S4 domain-containing protein [Enterobacterales bacterium]|nr:RNA-binding S4 domain-containing protein [Enterobacterales bacterium]
MNQFNLAGQPYITLDNLLKIEGICESGGRAKQVIASGAVSVDGSVETRKRCKIIAGQLVSLGDETIQVSE